MGEMEKQNVQDVLDASVEVAPLLQYITDWEGGLFHLTETEYYNKPAVVIEIRHLLAKVRNENSNPKLDRVRGLKKQ